MENSYRAKRTNGFTIVELIVIIVVIAILAVITVVSYGAITQNAKVQKITADAQTLNTALIKYKSETGSYPDSSAVGGVIASTKIPASSVQYTYTAGTSSYCLTVSVTGASVNVKSGSSKVSDGVCPGHVSS